VKTHGTDDLVRSFKTKHQFIALLFAQLSGAHSLRDIHTSMSSQRARLYHAGAVPPALDPRRREPRSRSDNCVAIAAILNHEGWRPPKRRDTFNGPMVRHVLIGTGLIEAERRGPSPNVAQTNGRSMNSNPNPPTLDS
jgi:hypothetical protein